ncbi:MAG: hypothetical protein MJE66_04425 [Proteobacteria bacterium]|nr:hypothetical protein [Pseudomonadota bacterium]
MTAIECPDQSFERGLALLKEERFEEALEPLAAAHHRDPANARVRSAYGLGLALARRSFDEAVELCRSAAKQEFFNPDLYLNLARVHLVYGFKNEAVRYLRRGLMIDPAHPGLDRALCRLGERRRPVLGFLPRRHLLNRWLGRARHRLGGGPRSLAA